MGESFEFDLRVKGKEETAAAASSVERLRGSLLQSSEAVKRMTTAYGNLKKAGLQETEQAKKLKATLDAEKRSVGEVTSKLLAMKNGTGLAAFSTQRLAHDVRGASTAMRDLAAGARLGGGPLGEAASRAAGFSSALGAAGVAGAAVAAGVAVVALDVVLLKHAATVTMAGIRAADGYRTEALAIEGMTQAWVGWYQQVKKGNPEDIRGAIDRVSSAVSTGREQVTAYSEALYRSRLRGAALEKALMGVSLAESAAGKEAAELAKNQIIQNAMWGRSIDGVVDRLQAQYGSINERKMLALSVQTAKLRENTNALFRGVNIEPVLSGVRKVLGILDQGTVEFKAWKATVETVFNPLFDGADEAGGVVRDFLDSVTIMTLDAALAWEDMKGSFSLKNLGIEDGAEMLRDGVEAATGFAVGVLELANAGIIAGRSIYNLGAIVVDFLKIANDMAGGEGDWKGRILKNAESMGKHAKALMNENGSELINGLIAGIERAQPKLDAAVMASANKTHEAFRRKEGIHSPAKAWEWEGRMQFAGLGKGQQKGANDVEANVPTLAGNVRSAAFGGGGGGSSGGGGRHFTWTGDLVLQGVSAGASTVTLDLAQVRAAVAQILEQEVIRAGAA